MARTKARSKAGRTERRRQDAKLLDALLSNPVARVALLSLALAIVIYFSRGLLAQETYPWLRDLVLSAVGLGAVPIALFGILVVATVQLRPRWLAQRWRWWLVAALLIAAAQTIMGSSPGTEGVLVKATLGGRVGQFLWGASLLQGVLLVGGLLLVAKSVIWPYPTLRELRWLVVAMGKLWLRLIRLVMAGALWAGHATFRGALRAVAAWLRRRGYLASADAASGTGPVAAGPGVGLPTDESSLGGDADAPKEREAASARGKEAVATGAKPREPAAALRWKLPPLDLLEEGEQVSITVEETAAVAREIEEALGNHGVEVTVEQIKPGPTVTLYGVVPGWIHKYHEEKERDAKGNIILDYRGKPVVTRREELTRVKVDSILAREKDMALALAAPSLRIQAPVPGESVVGIEVPNRDPNLVTLRSVIETRSMRDIVQKGGLPLGLGQGSGGDPVATDLRQLPHLLIAGATGSGKSVCINSIIVSLTSRVSPERLRLLLIDPKRVELTPYGGLPHLIAPVVVDTEPVVKALKGMLREMLRRYRRMEELGVRNIEGYRNHPQALEPMPYLVIVIDEMADLMMAAPYEIEQTICRLAQLGRATGIHLVVATQRPSVDVVTGLIKANFPSRISFAVVSHIDSRTILDAAGADRLLGKGDMLFLSNQTPKPQRVQGAFVSDREIHRLMEFWRSQKGPPLPEFNLEPAPEEKQAEALEEAERGGSSDDDLLEKAKEMATRYSHVSTSLLQRRLRIGYPRAARLMDQLEDEGVITQGEPGKTREVIRTAAPPEAPGIATDETKPSIL